jgi:hypothetical protein
MPDTISVSMKPGATALMVMPLAASSLARDLVRAATEIPDLADDGGDIHHAPPALLDHLVDEDLGAVEHTVEIDREDLAPGGVVHLDEGLVGVDTRVVDEDVEVAELPQDVLGHAEGVGEVCHVGLGEHGLAPHGGDEVDDFLGLPLT